MPQTEMIIQTISEPRQYGGWPVAVLVHDEHGHLAPYSGG
jgi:hypothetical protein